jgi:fructose-1,6-bisphosphatase/sedoheptulose 1,7-bisphosphatase-like protein
MTARPAPIPEPFGEDLQSLIATVMALKEAVETLQGLRGAPEGVVTTEALEQRLAQLEARLAALE